MITIQELLFNRGLDRQSRIKLVRHKDSRIDLYNAYRTKREIFLKYQQQQAKEVFSGVDYIVSFIGEEGLLSRFVGVYKVLRCRQLPKVQISVIDTPYTIEYDFGEILTFDDLKERVIVKWSNAISWHQWIKNEMEVIEIHPGLHYKHFTDYSDFILNFNELKEIITNGYNDWKRMLAGAKGIYLINDSKTGKLYVGSAYGEDGIWGRWSSYVSTNGHGGNKQLRELIQKKDDYAENFQFSILMILPKTITADQAVEKERLFKNKLGTNSFGLNSN
jgi:hypothetical protein